MGLLLTGGSVFDGHRYRGEAGVLLDGARVVAVGDRADLRERDGRAREVDCAGGLVAPGFIDAHVHDVQGGLERLRCDLSGCESAEACLDAIAAYADRVAPGDWLLGGGWSMASFPG